MKMKAISQRIVFLEQKNGKLTPEIVVKDAQNAKSPLHNGAGFEWDDSKAAHIQRIAHARTLIANVRANITTTTENYSYVSYMRDPRALPKEQGYVSVEKLRGDKKWAREAIDLEIKQVLARFERLREIAEPLGQQAQVDRMISDLQSFRRQLAA